MLDIAQTHFHRRITYWKDENTDYNCREIKMGSMILKINLWILKLWPCKQTSLLKLNM